MFPLASSGRMTLPNRMLLATALASAIGGGATIAIALGGWASASLEEISPAMTALIVFTGLVALLVGVYGVITWFALSGPLPGDAYLAEADRFAAEGKVEYARTYYEEALRAGADPEDVEHRLALVEARSRRASTHREPL